MCYLICYDISDDRRREHVADTLKDFGRRIQKSVFMADLDSELAARLHERILKLIDPHLDALHLFALCRTCAARGESYGIGEIPVDRDYYVL